MNQALSVILAIGLPERSIELVHQAVGRLRWRCEESDGDARLVCELRTLALPAGKPQRIEFHPRSEDVDTLRTIMAILEARLIYEANRAIVGRI